MKTRVAYRLYRNPIVMFLIGPAYIFVPTHRFGRRGARSRENRNVQYTNLGIAAFAIGGIWLLGWAAFLKIYIPVFVISGAGGVNPGLTLQQEGTAAVGEHPVALTGRVWCWCDADAGAIRPGDTVSG